jgi:D-glycero-alpha-D-manno-heptose-7-phosphate kinase
MIISRTPYRISFFGGGTDYPGWYRKHGGAVLATTIDKYCYITCRYLPPFFEHRIRIVYSKIEKCQTIDEIFHPSVREILRFLNIDRGVEIHHDGDLPARSGMGSSSSFTVGLLHALYALKGQMPGKNRLAQESIHIEQEILKETVGSQDQMSAAHGGFNNIEFSDSGEISIQPMTLGKERINELNSHLMLFYTGIIRTASNVAESYVNDIENRKSQFQIMSGLLNESITVLAKGKDINRFGELLHEAWQVKRSLSKKVSNPKVDEIYKNARSAGAVGGKLTGAGGGGFILLFVPPEKQRMVKEKLSKLIYVPFKFESSGSQIVVFNNQEDYSIVEREREKQSVSAFEELDHSQKGQEW